MRVLLFLRFTTETIGEETRVVAAKGKVCPVCGKVHGPDKTHPQAVQQVSGTKNSNQASRIAPRQIPAVRATSQQSRSATSATSTRNSTSQPKSSTARKNAARGTNRHVRKSSGDPEAQKSKGLFEVATESDDTDKPDEPGMLHRISSAVRKIGNPVLK